jgi:hypothetical protein
MAVVDSAVRPLPVGFARRRSFGSASAVTSFMAHLLPSVEAEASRELWLSATSGHGRSTFARRPHRGSRCSARIAGSGATRSFVHFRFCVMRRAAGGPACLASGRPVREARRRSPALVPALRPGFLRPARSAIGIRACRLPAPRAIDTQARTVPPAEDRRHERGLVEERWNARARAPPHCGGWLSVL